MIGRYEEALAAVDVDRDFGDAAFIYESMGRLDEALAVFDDRMKRLQAAGGTGAATMNFRIFETFRSALLGKPDALDLFDEFVKFPDPEGLYYSGRSCARRGTRSGADDARSRRARRILLLPVLHARPMDRPIARRRPAQRDPPSR